MLWLLFAALVVQLATSQVFSGSTSGLRTMNGDQPFSLEISIDVPDNEVTISMCSPDASLWFGFGFGNLIMANTYAIISEGGANGAISERILGNQAPGTLISSSFSSQSTQVNGMVKCINVTREIDLADRYSFPTMDTDIPIIFAIGQRAAFSRHAEGGCGNASISITGPPVGGGDPEYTFLDGGSFVYNGPCQYILVSNQCDQTGKNTVEDLFFTIMTRHGRSRSRTKDISIINAIIVNINDTYTIEIGKNNVITQNDLLLNENVLDIEISTVFEQNKKNEFEERIVVNLKNYFKLKVNLENNGVVWLDVDKKIHTCGILGNNNRIQYDDLVLSDGTILDEYSEENINIMCDSWQVEYNEEPLLCKLYPKESYIKKFYCKNFEYENISQLCDKFVQDNLNILGGKQVEECFSNVNETFVDATRIFDDCKTEVCNCREIMLERCAPQYAMEQFEEQCNNNGIIFVPVWNIN